MSARVNHPFKSFILFLLVCGVGYTAYHFVHVKGVLKLEKQTFVPREKLDEVREAILANFSTEECLLELGPVYYRPKDHRYCIELVVEDGYRERSQALCREVAELIGDEMGREPEVYAFLTGHIPVTRYLP